MKINILLPFKEKFDVNLASAVSITVKNNFEHTKFKKNIMIFGDVVTDPIYPSNFFGIKKSFNPLKSKNKYLAEQMVNTIKKEKDRKQIIELHNRPYLFKYLKQKLPDCRICLFLHNNPLTMKGSKTVKERVFLKDNAEFIFCVSSFVRKKFVEELDGDIDNILILYNGVSRTLKSFPSKKKEVLFIGRIVKEKGVDLYVNAVANVASDFPDWKFYIIGSSHLGIIKKPSNFEIKTCDDFNNIGNQAVFTGFLNHNDVQSKMRDASIIVVPSIWDEPFGLVVAEAMSNAAAVIASKVGGIFEIIRDNGFIIENIDVSKIETALRSLINNPQKLLLFQRKSWKNFDLSSHKSSSQLDMYRETIMRN